MSEMPTTPAPAHPHNPHEATDHRDLVAEAKAFGIDLIRHKVLFHKLDLERKTRTDRDIRIAVYLWKEQPGFARARFGHISDWDVSRVTNMTELFRVKWVEDTGYLNEKDLLFNEDLSKWDTGNVTDMQRMFDGASSFTSDLSKWQTGNVADMSVMFGGASSFTSDLSKWDT
eukprot:CAMPEP_0197492578 /NCGR_PEP_ID=MMETSP1311-20131121/11466_1 /TAXON_ID=464262 /ORGANISM="Genus nov. species nov., Strain RCC856" /LENGTH=171 /DNA_ID=CAMNT_0043037577 /DNA_START=42 /DNA_END=553 /DNA_ORIENTATION=+